jgi:hypothetical protein
MICVRIRFTESGNQYPGKVEMAVYFPVTLPAPRLVDAVNNYTENSHNALINQALILH